MGMGPVRVGPVFFGVVPVGPGVFFPPLPVAVPVAGGFLPVAVGGGAAVAVAVGSAVGGGGGGGSALAVSSGAVLGGSAALAEADAVG